MNNNIKIKEIDYGIACRIGNIIYVNKNLKENKELYESIIKHERSHSNSFNMTDITLDLVNSHLHGLKWQYYMFLLTHPSTWSEFLPIGYYDKKFVFNPIITGFYLIIGGLFGIIWTLS